MEARLPNDKAAYPAHRERIAQNLTQWRVLRQEKKANYDSLHELTGASAQPRATDARKAPDPRP